MADPQFSWVKTNKDIVEWLKSKGDKQIELIALLHKVGIKGLVDRDSQGKTYSLEAMDPFTFFCYIYKHKDCIPVLRSIAKEINSEPEPTEGGGIPTANPLTVRLFPVKDKRSNEIDKFWDFFFAAIQNRLNDELFADILSIPGIAPTKLSELLFYIMPDTYLCINGPTKPFIKEVYNIIPEFSTYNEYIELLNQIRQKTPDPFYKISHDAWIYYENKSNYWVFQCNPKIYDIVSALRELSTTHWRVSQHTNEIKKGDKVILWVTGSESGCYALGEVIGEVEYDIKDIEEQRFYKDDSYNVPFNRVKINILHNLVDRPILKSQISEINALSKLKAGLQGTNFKATKEQYDTLEKIAGGPVGKKYWLFAPGENAKMWDEFYSEGYMAIGWEKLGDLNNYGTKEEILAKLKETADPGDSENPYNDATANWEFKTVMNKGDIVIVKRGIHTLLGYGIVDSDYYFDAAKDQYQKCRQVKWIKKGEWALANDTLAIKTLTNITKYPADYTPHTYYYQQLLSFMTYPPIPVSKDYPLNVILYGPPGTGKTYQTVNKALEILGIDINGKSRSEIKDVFDEKMKNGQIVFTTFHQSMSYEDFIEGIKPIKSKKDEDPLKYKIEDGIFKALCRFAFTNSPKTIPSMKPNSTIKTNVKEEKFRELFNDYVKKLPDDKPNDKFKDSSVVLETERGNKFHVYKTATNRIMVRAGTNRTNSSISCDELVKVKYHGKKPWYGSYEDILINEILAEAKQDTINEEDFLSLYNNYLIKLPDSSQTHSDETFETKTGKKEALYKNSNNAIVIRPQSSNQDMFLTYERFHRAYFEKKELEHTYIPLILQRILTGSEQKESENIKVTQPKSGDKIAYVLIIDEINRGNVAQIFGEIITLIEEDKRLGSPEALEVTLPYSKEKFGVPPNLYIIGTMNTADRSIEALDTALRRRFCFEEITPRYDLVELDKVVAGFKLHELLKKINERIEKLIDKDHMIGHSYFMSVNDINDLKAVFQNKVNPLLQEYFFGDFGKIGLVLGAGFFENEGTQNGESQVGFASFNDYEDDELSSHPIYRLKNVLQMDDNEFSDAIATLMR